MVSLFLHTSPWIALNSNLDAGAVIVSTPQDVALIDVRKGVAMFRKMGIPVSDHRFADACAKKLKAFEQILGSVLNMSHFICPSCNEAHQVFGSSTRFDSACQDLDMQILGRVPLEPRTSEQGDAGTPIVLDASRPSVARSVFSDVAETIWQKLGQA